MTMANRIRAYRMILSKWRVKNLAERSAPARRIREIGVGVSIGANAKRLLGVQVDLRACRPLTEPGTEVDGDVREVVADDACGCRELCHRR
jgi:hypothetical protein